MNFLYLLVNAPSVTAAEVSQVDYTTEKDAMQPAGPSLGTKHTNAAKIRRVKSSQCSEYESKIDDNDSGANFTVLARDSTNSLGVNFISMFLEIIKLIATGIVAMVTPKVNPHKKISCYPMMYIHENRDIVSSYYCVQRKIGGKYVDIDCVLGFFKETTPREASEQVLCAVVYIGDIGNPDNYMVFSNTPLIAKKGTLCNEPSEYNFIHSCPESDIKEEL